MYYHHEKCYCCDQTDMSMHFKHGAWFCFICAENYDFGDLHECRPIDCYCGGYGCAIDECEEYIADGTLWAGNSEYCTRVNFCPFCGYESKNKYKVLP